MIDREAGRIMGDSYTITIHTQPGAAMAHNRRDRAVTDKEAHIDREGRFEVWFDRDLKQTYKEIFGAAVDKYNTEQERPARRVQDYYQQVRRSKQQHTVYEMIAQVGNVDNHPDTETSRAILKQFVDDWPKRNPNMILVGAYWHADEQGCDHLHADFVPVGHYEHGLSVRNGYAQALKEQGYTGKQAAAKWWASENRALEQICNNYGLSIEHPQRGKGVEHITTEAYKAQKQAQTVLDGINSQIEARTAYLAQLQRESRISDPLRYLSPEDAARLTVLASIDAQFPGGKSQGDVKAWIEARREYTATAKVLRANYPDLRVSNLFLTTARDEPDLNQKRNDLTKDFER